MKIARKNKSVTCPAFQHNAQGKRGLRGSKVLGRSRFYNIKNMARRV